MRKIITLILLLIIAFCLSQCVFANDIQNRENIETSMNTVNQQSNEHLESQNFNEKETGQLINKHINDSKNLPKTNIPAGLYLNSTFLKNNNSYTIYGKLRGTYIAGRTINIKDYYNISLKESQVKTKSDGTFEYTINDTTFGIHTIEATGTPRYKEDLPYDRKRYEFKDTPTIIVNYINSGKLNEIEIRGKYLDKDFKEINSNENYSMIATNPFKPQNLQKITINKDGTFKFTLDLCRVYSWITITSEENKDYLSQSIVVPIEREYSDNTAYLGKKSNLTITIPDQKNTVINKGYCIFKINGLTLKDEYNNTIKRNVVNGKVLFDYLIPSNYKQRDYLLEMVYIDDSNEFYPVRIIKDLHVLNGNFELEIDAHDFLPFTRYNRTRNIKVALYKNNHSVDNGFLILKINGVTIKDENNQTRRYYLNSGILKHKLLTLQFPYHWSQKTIKITAIYNDVTYGRIENSTYIQLWKAPINMSVNTTLLKSRKVVVNGFIKDYNKDYVKGSNVIGVKINGLTLKDKNGKVLYFKANNGRINFTFTLPEEYKKDNYNITLVTGERKAYLGTYTTTQLRSKQ